MKTVRYLSFAVADGAHNMAADEVLLESAATGIASLRFYAWSVPTASLGYFQPAQVLQSDPLLASLPFVRRPSGGATLVHHHEVTYCLALPAGAEWQGGEPWLQRMHKLVAAALRELHVEVRPHVQDDPGSFPGVLCFQHYTRGDLMLERYKVVGSAQRRQRGALMQHGGILLARSSFAPSLPGIQDLSGRAVGHEMLISTILRAFCTRTDWNVTPGEWTREEQQRIADLAIRKYGQDAWNRKR